MPPQNASTFAAPVKRLELATIAPGKPYHAALSSTESSRAGSYRFTEHNHDFYELMFVVAADAVHGINGETMPLRAGDLIFLHPDDKHFVRFQSDAFLHYINIAVEAELYRTFQGMIGLSALLDRPADRKPTIAALYGAAGDDCATAFRRALERFQEPNLTVSSLRIEACRFLSIVIPWLTTASSGGPSDVADSIPSNAPSWLIHACRTLQRDPIALQHGLSALIAESGVTGTHLARVLKAFTDQTPTEFVNRLRIERAARLLATTTMPILEVAAECGFEQASYFYRLFHARFETSPLAYRFAAAHRVAPQSVARS